MPAVRWGVKFPARVESKSQAWDHTHNPGCPAPKHNRVRGWAGSVTPVLCPGTLPGGV